jgi:hypothetical protein
MKFGIREMRFNGGLPSPISASKFLPDIITVRPNGKVRGRRRKITDSNIGLAKKLLASGASYKDVARNFGVSEDILYYWIPASSMHDM